MNSEFGHVRWLAISLLLLSCGWALAHWISAGVVQWVATQTEHRLEISPTERSRFIEQLLKTASWTPANPLLWETLVQLEPDPERKLIFLDRLLQMRPGDSQALASTFSIRLGLGLNDETTEAALRKSLAEGGWEPDALQIIVDAGTFYWLVLSADARGLVIEAARRALVNPHGWRAGKVLALLKQRGFLRITCAALSDQQSDQQSGQQRLPGYCLNFR